MRFTVSIERPAKCEVLPCRNVHHTGLGAFSSPLVATQFSTQHHWSFHYLISLGLSISNIILLTATFRLKTQDRTFIYS